MNDIKIKYVKKVNLGIITFFWGFIFTVITTILTMLGVLISIYPINTFLNSSSTFVFIMGGLLLMFSFFLLIIELLNRSANDSIYNLMHSIHMTFRFREFLERESDDKKGTSITLPAYDKSIKRVVIDVTNNSVCFYLKLPINVQAQNLIKEIQVNIKEQIASDFPNYSFSDFIKREGYLILNGTKY